MTYARDDTTLAAMAAKPNRPVLLAHGCVLTGDATLGDWAEADVLIGGGVVVGVGPGLDGAADDDGMIAIDCRGCVVMCSGGGRLVPAEAASIAVYRLADGAAAPSEPVVNRPSHLDILLIEGRPVIWGGAAVAGAPEPTPMPHLKLVDIEDDDPRLGLWSDDRDFLRQRLLPGGRYDEARGTRDSAYRGRFWINGDRIDYLDDAGFWAFGVFTGDRLDHAGYVLRRNT